MANDNLGQARSAQNDEFYTQYNDVQKEMNAYLEYNPDVFRGKTVLLPCDDPEWSNFTKFFAQKFQELGLKKLISTSYAPKSKPIEISYQPTLFEVESPLFDATKAQENGKIFTLTSDKSGDGVVNFEDLEWGYLEGDGDFRSDEVAALRAEADIIITNPPFSLFREFLSWLTNDYKQFVVIGNKNAITYREIFPLIKENLMWLGSTPMSTDLLFGLPKSSADELVATKKEGSAWKRVDGVVLGRSSSVWFTNIDHGRRHEPLELMTEKDNIRFNKTLDGKKYQRYDNYDAIEVPRTDAIPSDYQGVMGVPISFLSKYNPEQFEILGCSYNYGRPAIWPRDTKMSPSISGVNVYKRIFIQRKKEEK